MMKKTLVGTPDPTAAPEWLVERVNELSRLMHSSDRSIADGIWTELIERGLVKPQIVPGRVMGPLGWKSPTATQSAVTGAVTGVASAVVIESGSS